MNKYKDITTKELKALWEKQRLKVTQHSHTQSDLDALLAMRKELDRRRGERNPTVSYNFEGDLTD